MRHNKGFNHLGRKSGHRKAMLANMASSLILHKRIETTVAKAKALREYVEPLITKSKEDTTHSRRTVFAYLKQKEAVTELFRVVAPKVMDRPGGYTRIIKTGFRVGDAADMALIELVDFNEHALASTTSKKEEKKATTRRGRAKKSATPAAEAEVAPKAPKAEKAPKAAKKEEAPAEVAPEAPAEVAPETPAETAPETPAETAPEAPVAE